MSLFAARKGFKTSILGVYPYDGVIFQDDDREREPRCGTRMVLSGAAQGPRDHELMLPAAKLWA